MRQARAIRYPSVPAINYARKQCKEGPAFPEGFCLGAVTRAFFGHPSGEPTATIGWEASEKKHPFRHHTSVALYLKSVPRGFPLWWSGGSPTENHPEGCGHVVIAASPGFCWSTDRLRIGYFNRVEVKAIMGWNRTHPLHLLGWSEDIAGFKVPYRPHSKDPIR